VLHKVLQKREKKKSSEKQYGAKQRKATGYSSNVEEKPCVGRFMMPETLRYNNCSWCGIIPFLFHLLMS